MATTLYLRATTPAVSVGSDLVRGLSTSRGAASTDAVKNTVTGPVTPPTAATQLTLAAGGTVVTWVSDPVAAFTMAGSITVNIRARESATQANATVVAEILRLGNDGSIISTPAVVGTAGTELTTSDAAKVYNKTPTSTAFSAGDRIGVRIYIDDGSGVTMASARTVTVTYDGPTGAAAGDTFVTLTETISFVAQGSVSGQSAASGAASHGAAATGSVTAASGAAGTGGKEAVASGAVTALAAAKATESGGRRSPTPADGIFMWLIADELAGGEADPVGLWGDYSGAGSSVSQLTGSRQPLLRLNAVNGHKALEFDGTDVLGSGNLALSQEYTMFAVVFTATNATMQVVSADFGGSPRIWQFRFASSSNIQAIAFDSSGNPFTDSVGYTNNQYIVASMLRDADSVEAFVDGSSNGETATTGTPASGTRPLFIGAQSTTENFLVGRIAEVLLYRRALTLVEHGAVVDYLKAKYLGPSAAEGAAAGKSASSGTVVASASAPASAAGLSTSSGTMVPSAAAAGSADGRSTSLGSAVPAASLFGAVFGRTASGGLAAHAATAFGSVLGGAAVSGISGDEAAAGGAVAGLSASRGTHQAAEGVQGQVAGRSASSASVAGAASVAAQAAGRSASSATVVPAAVSFGSTFGLSASVGVPVHSIALFGAVLGRSASSGTMVSSATASAGSVDGRSSSFGQVGEPVFHATDLPLGAYGANLQGRGPALELTGAGTSKELT